MDDKRKIKEKITKLLAKAQGTDNEAEAATFMEKVEQLLEEHQIQQWELGDQDDQMGQETMLKATTSSPSWKKHVLQALAAYYGCRTMRCTYGKNYEVKVIGRESARVTTELMYPFVIKQVNAAGSKLKAEGQSGSLAQLQRRVGNALVLRIQKLVDSRDYEKAQQAKANPVSSKNKMALQTIDELRAFVEQAYPNATTGRGRSIGTSGAARGAAGGISLNRGVGGASQKRLT